MIKSRYIEDILILLIGGQEFEVNLKIQLELIVDLEYTYTGSGLIVTFMNDPKIEKYRINFDQVLNGVKITSSELDLGAQASLFFNNGTISYLEIFSNSSVYPMRMLKDYRLSQEWLPQGG